MPFDTPLIPREFVLSIGDQTIPATWIPTEDIGGTYDLTDTPTDGLTQCGKEFDVTLTFCDDDAIAKFYKLAYGHNEKVCRYFLKHNRWNAALGILTEAELLKIIPNNVKRRMGLPTSRGCHAGRTKKRDRKNPVSVHEIRIDNDSWEILAIQDIPSLKRSRDLLRKERR